MTTGSPILGIPQVVPGQNLKEVTINNAVAALEAAMNAKLPVVFTSANVTLSPTQFASAFVFVCSGNSTALSLIVPAATPTGAIQSRMFTVLNNGSAAVTVSGTSGASVAVAPNAFALLLYDGANVSETTSASSAVVQPWDFLLYYSGVLPASQTLSRVVIARSVLLPASLGTSPTPKCSVAPTGSVTISIKQNGTVIGTINFAAGATSGTFTFSSAITLSSGDIFEIDAPTTADATFAGLSATIVGTR